MTSSAAALSDSVRAALSTDMTIDITTTGRRSGEPRRIEIWFLNVDGTIYITGSPGQRDWFANLLANPDFVFHLKESVQADLAARADNVTDPTERSGVLHTPTAQWYRDQDSMEDLLADAPMVRVSFV